MSIYAPPGLGTVVQVVSTLSSAVATGTTIIPFDDTIPQNTEGDQYMTVSITPQSTTNTLVIQTITYLSSSVGGQDLTVAIFQDSNANALAANGSFMATATGRTAVPLSHAIVAGTTASTTFKVRAGGNLAGTTTFNGFSGGRLYGATTKSSIVVWEYKS